MIEGVGVRVRAPTEGPCSSIAGEMAWTETLVDELAECVTSSWLTTSEDDDMDSYSRTTDETLSFICYPLSDGRLRTAKTELNSSQLFNLFLNLPRHLRHLNVGSGSA